MTAAAAPRAAALRIPIHRVFLPGQKPSIGFRLLFSTAVPYMTARSVL
jgi:hypothetical protein